jgi:hypothetical protein
VPALGEEAAADTCKAGAAGKAHWAGTPRRVDSCTAAVEEAAGTCRAAEWGKARWARTQESPGSCRGAAGVAGIRREVAAGTARWAHTRERAGTRREEEAAGMRRAGAGRTSDREGRAARLDMRTVEAEEEGDTVAAADMECWVRTAEVADNPPARSGRLAPPLGCYRDHPGLSARSCSPPPTPRAPIRESGR